MARVTWVCPHCGIGQVLQLPVASDASRTDLRKIVSGMPDCYRASKPVSEGML